MDPYEQRLRDEVIYLHSLWHKGPPRNPNPNSRPKSNPVIALHQPSNSPSFKNNGTTSTTTTSKNKKKRKKKKKIKPQDENDGNKSDPPTENCDIQWQSEKPVEESTTWPSGWTALKLKQPQSGTRQLSAEEQANLIAAQMQQKGLEATRGFFLKNCGSDGDEEDGDDDEDDEDEDMDDDCEECEEHKFFFKLFMEDSELRGYYEKNFESGDFYCLVCGGIGKKVWKKYKNGVAIVQHSIAISKTAKRRAHRAYGQVICKVLGWNISRLPTIVLSVDDTVRQSLVKSGDSQVDPNGNVDSGNDNLNKQNEDTDVCREITLADCSTGDSNIGTRELIAAENASKGGDANTHVEDSGKGISDLGTTTEGLMSCSEMLNEYGAGGVQIETNKINTEITDLDDLKEDGANQNRGLLDKEVAEAPKI